MQSAAAQPTLYDALAALPEGITGEILDGQLQTQPRPSGRHARAESALHSKLFRSYDDGDGGPGGWWILVEPELHFIRDREVAVPDIAGSRRTRLPRLPEDQRFEAVPDWLCEVLSPSTESKDRRIKMPLYARYGVRHVWLVDPIAKTLEAYALAEGAWEAVGVYRGSEKGVRAEPFTELAIDLASLWV
jgi:Uma2 family endonuclease